MKLSYAFTKLFHKISVPLESFRSWENDLLLLKFNWLKEKEGIGSFQITIFSFKKPETISTIAKKYIPI